MAPLDFMLGVLKLPVAVKLWLMVLMVANAGAPLFFFHRLEARVVLGTFFASFLLMSLITAMSGFTRLLGLGHALWVPLVAFLLVRLGAEGGTDLFAGMLDRDPYRVWIVSVIILNSISLVMDAVDVIRFVRGERAEIVSVTAPP